MIVKVVKYNPKWIQLFEKESKESKSTLLVRNVEKLKIRKSQ